MYSKCTCFNNLKRFFNYHNFSTSINYLKSHYDALGITPKATQTDIKSAYYKLSMVYHPDKNKGSVEASKKFQEITGAYEVLGNYKNRRLYDKGILHTAGIRFAQEPVDFTNPEEKFYQSRKDRHAAPHMSGRTPIYDFDEWARAHYATTFQRSNTERVRYHQKVARVRQDKIDFKNESIIMGFMSLLFVCMVISYIHEQGYDNVKNKNGDVKGATVD